MPILTPEERLGQVVAERYRLDALLSIGGMGVLFRAVEIANGRRCAIKMLKPIHSLESDRLARFARESRIAQALSHPHVARTLDAFTDESGVPFLVMELLEGRTLAEELQQRGELPLSDALAIVLPIVRALEAAHALGIVHRDLKPSNIFLARGENGAVTPKLLDFGIAKSPEDGFETETGMLVGTPGYMAPEQIQYGECSAFTDIWGIGAVLYHCLTGHPPHALPNASALLSKLVREPVPALECKGLGRQVCATIDRALAREPHLRYPSMRAFGRALASFADDGAATETATHCDMLAAATRGPAAARAKRFVFARVPTSVLAFVGALGVLALASIGAGTGISREQPAAVALAMQPAEREPPQLSSKAPTPIATFDAVVPIVRAVADIPTPTASRVRAVRTRSRPRRSATLEHHVEKRREPIETDETSGLPVATEW